ncbi:MAG: hypothetical protein FJ167_02395 [Gammaproteobacteria bacterium]|nr:hypothetical protein [Gammaproteobacteria bacterium]MBM4223644.1 hypothetical protein [Gammaproteobacteria bacterium]
MSASSMTRRNVTIGTRRRALSPAFFGVLVLAVLGSLASRAATGADAITVTATTLPRAAEAPAMPVRIAAPRAGKALPVIVFSHGAYSSKDDYSVLLDHWAAHGYVVIAVTHRDSIRLGTTRGSNDPRFMSWRLDDLKQVLGSLPQLLSVVPGLAARTDSSKIAATGHSFGGLIAQTLAGATLRDPATGSAVSHRQPAIRAAIIFSGAGAMSPVLGAEDFAALAVPTLVTVGTLDLQQAPNLGGYEWRRQPYDLIPAGQKYLLILEGADHYLGGRVGRDDLPRSPQADDFVAAFQAASTLFLDATLKDQPPAKARLNQLPSTPAPFAAHATLQQR